ncbi:heavy metal translocating P-type ATPase [Mangrovicella endophytica]|uniref:heavy metal translocating P-type ATPase n=1 Tax=Mangrovicella endophytica TaxID=2066697 RepID=UPI000C9E8DD3|nr:heavy metal translocating P-type ATPase [Mangrovicella endophytica]
MSCCIGVTPDQAADFIGSPDALRREEFRASGVALDDDSVRYVLAAPAIHCAACIQTIERGLKRVQGVRSARVNFSTRRVMVEADAAMAEPFQIVETLEKLGYKAELFDLSGELTDGSAVTASLIRALVVAGFASANVMLLSVSVWSGADGTTRTLFLYLSALLAVPATLYAGQPFYRSAWSALRSGRLNMDVPIALAVLLTLGLSVYEATIGTGESWFDASVSLIFFLLIGRVLDHLMRERARGGVEQLTRLAAKGAMRIMPDGSTLYVPVDEIRPGMRLLVAVGERFAVDCRLADGTRTDVDRSMATGESLPVSVSAGAKVEAGAVNLTRSVEVEATADAGHSLVSEMVRLMEAAEQGKASYVRLADKLATLYAPLVHILAFSTFAGWMLVTQDWHAAIRAAVCVLIVTCPCALGLAVPIAQVVGASILMRRGILVRNGSAFERMAEVRQAVFDKTGTLTLPHLKLGAGGIDDAALAAAAGLASNSRHPLSQAVTALAAGRGVQPLSVTDVGEIAGAGIEGRIGDMAVRLGRRDFAAAVATGASARAAGEDEATLWFAGAGFALQPLAVEAELRPDAEATLREFQAGGITSHLLSGDTAASVEALRARLPIAAGHAFASMSPAAKVERIAALGREGGPVLFVGDGINDAPALGAAHVSMTPAAASDVGRANADFVFLNASLAGVIDAWKLSRAVVSFVKQNFAIAIAYNTIAIPLAMFGGVTPLIAAIAMSSSSIIVVGNTLRLRLRFPDPKALDVAAGAAAARQERPTTLEVPA